MAPGARRNLDGEWSAWVSIHPIAEDAKVRRTIRVVVEVDRLTTLTLGGVDPAARSGKGVGRVDEGLLLRSRRHHLALSKGRRRRLEDAVAV